MLHYSEIFDALVINYLDVYLIDPETNTAQVVKLEGYVTPGIESDAKKLNYDEMLGVYAKNRVYEEDRPNFINSLNRAALLETFKGDRKQLEYSYRVYQDGDIHYYNAHYVRLELDGGLKLVAGFRNIDSIISEQVRHAESGMYKAYDALSSIYLSMQRIDLKNNTFTEIKASSYIHNALASDSMNYDDNIERVVKATCAPSFLSSVMPFMDIHTLSERMKGRNYISTEFMSIFSGWCKGTFIKEDEDSEGNLWHVIWTIELIDEEKRREDDLRHLAETDVLTGLLNRRAGEFRMKKLISQGTSGLFVIMDIDHFKGINDTFGHNVGDMAIIEIANVLQEACRSSDVVMRLGGDEFALFAPGLVSEERAQAIWSKATECLKNKNIPELKGGKLSISGGGVLFKGNSNADFNVLYKAADDQLYLAKRHRGYREMRLTKLD